MPERAGHVANATSRPFSCAVWLGLPMDVGKQGSHKGTVFWPGRCTRVCSRLPGVPGPRHHAGKAVCGDGGLRGFVQGKGVGLLQAKRDRGPYGYLRWALRRTSVLTLKIGMIKVFWII